MHAEVHEVGSMHKENLYCPLDQLWTKINGAVSIYRAPSHQVEVSIAVAPHCDTETDIDSLVRFELY